MFITLLWKKDLYCICPIGRSFHPYVIMSFCLMKIFITLFSVTWKSRELKLVTQVNNGWMYHVYQNHDAATYSFHYFSIVYTAIMLLLLVHFFISPFFSLSQIFRLQMKMFVPLFSVTIQPRELKLGTHGTVGGSNM